jgi:hypothetical protein
MANAIPEFNALAALLASFSLLFDECPLNFDQILCCFKYYLRLIVQPKKAFVWRYTYS